MTVATVAYFVDSQIDSGVGQDPQNVRDVALVEYFEAVGGVQLLGAVEDAAIFARFPERQSGFHHLEIGKNSD